MANNDKNNFGFFAAAFAAIFGSLYGIHKAVSGASEANRKKKASIDAEREKLNAAIEKLFIEGKDETTIIDGLLLLVREQMGNRLNEKGIEQVKGWVKEVKLRLQKEGKIQS